MFSRPARAVSLALKEAPPAALALSALAWVALWVLATAAGGAELYVSSMSVGRTVGSAAVFLGAWEIMIVAMMLPSSIGFLGLFRVVTSASSFRAVRTASVGIGYALAWAWMGWATMLVGATLYRSGSVDVWLESHANLLAGGVLVLAGGFQLTTLKRRCLAICNNPVTFLMRHYQRGIGSALALGLRFGFVCLGCCWALMALMVVLGGGSLLLMMLLSVIMFAERAMGWDDRFVKAVGLTGIALGVCVATAPDAVPALAHNAGGWIAMNSTMQMPDHGWPLWCHA
jgi:predicted metal-binding membrane protein